VETTRRFLEKKKMQSTFFQNANLEIKNGCLTAGLKTQKNVEFFGFKYTKRKGELEYMPGA